MADQQQDYAVLEKQVATIESSLVEMTKRAEMAERGMEVSKLAEDDRSAYAALSKEEQDQYHACKDSNCKDGLLTKGYEILEKRNAVPEHIAKQFEDFKKQLAESNTKREAAEKAIAKAQHEADILRFSKQASVDYGNLPGTDVEKGSILKALSEKLTTDELAGVTKLLSAGDAAQAMVQKSVGGSSGSTSVGNDIWSQIVAKSKEFVSKDGKKVSEAAAIDQYLTTTAEGKSLYKQYLSEQGRQ